MSSAANLKTRCPVCNKKYQLPVTAAGQKARCSDCHTVFRVPTPPPADRSFAEPVVSHRIMPRPEDPVSSGRNGDHARKPHPPTEEDILRWLSEAEDESEKVPQPRIVQPRIASAPPGVGANGTPGSSSRRESPSAHPSSAQDPAPAPSVSGSGAGLAPSATTSPTSPKPLRKTG